MSYDFHDPQAAYLFLDESGNFDFSRNGTRYFTLTAISTRRPFNCAAGLQSLRFDLLEEGVDIQYFHASEDSQTVRNRVFDVIGQHLPDFRVDSVIVEKRKTGRSLREPERFYPEMLKHLLKYVFRRPHLRGAARVIVMTDALPIRKKRAAVERGIRKHMPGVLPSGMAYEMFHHDSKSCSGLQIADYFNWAIYRKWDGDDRRSYDLIAPVVQSEFDIFRVGRYIWY